MKLAARMIELINTRRLATAAVAIGVGLSPSVQAGPYDPRDFLVEIAVFSRDGAELCGDIVPTEWVAEGFALFLKATPPVSEDEMRTKTEELEVLYKTGGKVEWCKRYSLDRMSAV
jgi:hypothetical protein